jgi:glycosyltransferase involved in cell wall biosynthesis
MSVWIYNVASRLVSHHHVFVYSNKGPHQEEAEVFRGIQCRRISTTVDSWIAFIVNALIWRIPGLEKTLRKRPYFASIFYQLTYILKVAKELQTTKCDIVHIIEETEHIGTIRALNPKIRIVLHMQCEHLTQLDHNMIERRLRKADLILGCSMYITNKIRQSFPSLARRCQTLYNGVDLATYVNDPKKKQKKLEFKQLLFVSRVTPEKGLHVLIEALKKVVEKDPYVHLEIVGPVNELWTLGNAIWLSDDKKVQELASFHTKGSSNPYFDYLTQKLISLNISDKVTFHGKIPHDQTIKLYQTSDILIQPSIFHEPFGMAIIEAMACQIPVVGTKVGGIPEIIEDGKTGLLVESRDCRALAKALLELLSNEDLRMKMGKMGKERAESFSWDTIVTNLLSLYEYMFECSRAL